MDNNHANSLLEAPGAAPDSAPGQLHEVVLLALEEVVALDLTIATHVFAHEDNGRYRVRLARAGSKGRRNDRLTGVGQ